MKLKNNNQIDMLPKFCMNKCDIFDHSIKYQYHFLGIKAQVTNRVKRKEENVASKKNQFSFDTDKIKNYLFNNKYIKLQNFVQKTHPWNFSYLTRLLLNIF